MCLSGFPDRSTIILDGSYISLLGGGGGGGGGEAAGDTGVPISHIF